MLLAKDHTARVPVSVLATPGEGAGPVTGLLPAAWTAASATVARADGTTLAVPLTNNVNWYEIDALAAPGLYHLVLPAAATSVAGALQLALVSADPDAYPSQTSTHQVAADGPRCGLGFLLDSVEVRSRRQLRVRWTAAPNVAAAGDPASALTAANYALAGDIAPAITMVTVVSSDDEVVDLYLAADLPLGAWTLTVSTGVTTAEGRAALAPYTVGFTVGVVVQDPISLGAKNKATEAVLTSFLNPAYRGRRAWGALAGGVASQLATVQTAAVLAQDQLYPASASGRYLDRRGGDLGLARPLNTGLTDAVYRDLLIGVTNEKLTQEALLRIGEVLYGKDAVRAYVATAQVAPYKIFDGATLEILLDEALTVPVTFRRAEFRTILRAGAAEVAAAINRALRGQRGAEAVVHRDPVTAAELVRIRSGARGLRSSVRITGGTAQPSLGFADVVPSLAGAPPAWTITDLGGGVWRWQPTDAAVYDLSTVLVGDYVVVRGYEFAAANRGSFGVVGVSYGFVGPDLVQYVDLQNPTGVTESVQQCVTDSVTLFRPTRRTVYDEPAYYLVSQAAGAARVSMAATTRAVFRRAGTAAYANANPAVVVSTAVRDDSGGVVVTTAAPHGLEAGQQVLIDGARGGFTVVATDTGVATAAFGSAVWLQGRSAVSAVTTVLKNTTVNRVYAGVATDLDGALLVLGGEQHSNTGTITTVQDLNSLRLAGRPATGGVAYTWGHDDLSADAAPPRPIGRVPAVLEDEAHRNQLLVLGGHATSQWQAYADNAVSNAATRLTKRLLREVVLHLSQLSNTQGILGAFGLELVANPAPGDLLSIGDGVTTRIYGFGSGGQVVVTIGGSAAATATNLAAAINGDGSATFGAVAVGSSVVVIEDAVGAGRCGLRAYGTFVAAAVVAEWYSALGGATYPTYDYPDRRALATADPGPMGGFHRKLAALTDQELHPVISSGALRQWSSTGPSWGAAASQRLWTPTGTTATSSVRVADAAAAVLPVGAVYANRVMVTGGVSSGASQGLNQATATLQSYNPVANTWELLAPLTHARMQHRCFQVPTGVLVVGGRQPAALAPIDLGPAFDWWRFDDAAATTDLVGPAGLTVARNSNPRPPGKIGWGLRLVGASVASASAEQDLMNAALLGDYTLSFWMTSRQGTVVRNLHTAQADAGDNRLLEFGVDDATDRFYLSWQHGTNTTVTALLPADQLRATLMPYAHHDSFPRYYHVAITKTTGATTSVFAVYVNGVLIGTVSGVSPSGGGDGTWRFGEAGVFGVAFTGSLDEVGFAATEVLTAAEVRRLYLTQCGQAYESPFTDAAYPVGTVLNSCELVVESAGVVTAALAAPMAYARYGYASCGLPDGRILVAGGLGYPATSGPSDLPERALELRSAEIYDPRTGIWQQLPDMRDPHSHGVAALAPETNRVYVAGGFTSRRIEYLDLQTMRWGVSTAVLDVVRAHASGGGSFPALVGGGQLVAPAGTIEETAAGDYGVAATGEGVRAGGLNVAHQVLTVPSSTTFTVQDHGHLIPTTFTGGTATAAAAAPLAAGLKGPYSFDPRGGFGVAAVAGTAQTALHKGVAYTEIELAANEADAFPDAPGYLVLGWGWPYQVGPVRYLGRTSPQTLALDGAFVLPAEVPAGARVRLLFTRAPFVPDDALLGQFWLTDSPAGRVAAQQLVVAASAAGIPLAVEIRYPGGRGLGAEGFPTRGNYKLADVVPVWAGGDVDADEEAQRNG